jgi:hypothetical protein
LNVQGEGEDKKVENENKKPPHQGVRGFSGRANFYGNWLLLFIENKVVAVSSVDDNVVTLDKFSFEYL